MGKRAFIATGLATMATAVALLGGPTAVAQETGSVGTSGHQGTAEVNASCDYRVTANKLSVRSEPAGSLTGRYFYKDDIVQGEFGKNIRGYKFVTKRGSSTRGWVNASYLQAVGTCP